MTDDADAGPYEGLTDEQVMEIARHHHAAEASQPPLSLARIAAAQQYDRAKAELDRRALAFVMRRLRELRIEPGDPVGEEPPAPGTGDDGWTFPGLVLRGWTRE